MGHVIGHLKDISKAGAQDNVTYLGVLLLLGNRARLGDVFNPKTGGT